MWLGLNFKKGLESCCRSRDPSAGHWTDSVVTQPCCWTLSHPGMSLGCWGMLGTPIPCSKSVPKQDFLLLTLVLL